MEKGCSHYYAQSWVTPHEEKRALRRRNTTPIKNKTNKTPFHQIGYQKRDARHPGYSFMSLP